MVVVVGVGVVVDLARGRHRPKRIHIGRDLSWVAVGLEGQGLGVVDGERGCEVVGEVVGVPGFLSL